MATRKRARPARRPAQGAANKTATGTPFDAITKDDVEKFLTTGLPENVDVTAKFIAGDHWQGGDGWIGPAPESDDQDYSITLELIERGFTSRNVTREITNRHMRGVVGEEPVFGMAPRTPIHPGDKINETQEKTRRLIEAALTDWFDSRAAHLAIQTAVANAVWSTRGPLRLYVPKGKLADGAIPKQADLATALSLIYLDAPSPLNATVYTDEDTKERIGVLATEANGKRAYEVTYLAPDTTAPGQPADPKNPRATVLRTISEDADTSVEVMFGGRMTMYAIERDSLISPQLNQLQRALNLCLSMIPRNVVTAGFLERMILNALPPGHWETDSRGKKIRFVRENWETGPGTTQFIRGIELPQKDGSVALTTPSVTMREPVDAAPTNVAKRALYQDMLEEADQAHVLMTSEVTPSGASRTEGRADFEVSLSQTKAPTNAAGRWLIEALLGMAEQFMQTPGALLTEWRAQFECRVNTGPVPIDERTQVIAEYGAGLLSEDTALARIGVVDVQAEQDRITASNGGKSFSFLNRVADLLVKLSQAGAAIEGAAEFIGVSKPDALLLMGGDGTGNPKVDPNGNPLPADNPPGANPPANTGDSGGGDPGTDNNPPSPRNNSSANNNPNNTSQGGGNQNAGA